MRPGLREACRKLGDKGVHLEYDLCIDQYLVSRTKTSHMYVQYPNILGQYGQHQCFAFSAVIGKNLDQTRSVKRAVSGNPLALDPLFPPLEIHDPAS